MIIERDDKVRKGTKEGRDWIGQLALFGKR
jgi:hypothetical protein